METDTPPVAPKRRGRPPYKKAPKPLTFADFPTAGELTNNAENVLAVEAEPVKPPLDDSNARAARRARELRALGNVTTQEGDIYYIDPRIVPAGWTYEWKRYKLVGEKDDSYQTELRYRGWDEVPCARHPSMMPQHHMGNTIERKGMVLMERPKEITAEVQATERRKADDQVRTRKQQLANAPPGQFDRVDGHGAPQVKVHTEYAPIAKDD